MTEGTWLAEAKKNAGLLIFLGILTVIFGLLAVASPLITGIAVSMFVGSLLFLTGISQIVHAFKSKQWGTGFWGTVVGLLAVGAGLVMLLRPGVGVVTMAMILAIYFLVDGISEIIAAFRIKPDQGWGWVLFNGVVAVLLGFLIWRQWPFSGAWAVGLLVGIHILISGWSMIILGTGARRIAGAVEEVVEDVVDKAEEVVEKAADVVEDAAEKVGDVVEDAADKVEDVFERDKD
jgi:uncharacterized membrane protein HdeD (DUF308 family)